MPEEITKTITEEITSNLSSEDLQKIITILQDISTTLLHIEFYLNALFSILIVFIMIFILYKIISYFMYSY